MSSTKQSLTIELVQEPTKLTNFRIVDQKLTGAQLANQIDLDESVRNLVRVRADEIDVFIEFQRPVYTLFTVDDSEYMLIDGSNDTIVMTIRQADGRIVFTKEPLTSVLILLDQLVHKTIEQALQLAQSPLTEASPTGMETVTAVAALLREDGLQTLRFPYRLRLESLRRLLGPPAPPLDFEPPGEEPSHG